MAKTDRPANAENKEVQPGDQVPLAQNRAAYVDPGVGKIDDHDVSPKKHERPSSNTTVQRAGDTGFENPHERRLVRVLQKSYLNGAEFEAGAITYWPKGVEKLGRNLEEYKG